MLPSITSNFFPFKKINMRWVFFFLIKELIWVCCITFCEEYRLYFQGLIWWIGENTEICMKVSNIHFVTIGHCKYLLRLYFQGLIWYVHYKWKYRNMNESKLYSFCNQGTANICWCPLSNRCLFSLFHSKIFRIFI